MAPSPALTRKATGGDASQGRPRRSPTTGDAQTKRVEWGQKWGAITSRIGREIREGQ